MCSKQTCGSYSQNVSLCFYSKFPNLFHDFFSYNVKLLFFSDTQEHYGIDQKNWNIFRQIPVESNSTKEKPLEKDLMK